MPPELFAGAESTLAEARWETATRRALGHNPLAVIAIDQPRHPAPDWPARLRASLAGLVASVLAGSAWAGSTSKAAPPPAPSSSAWAGCAWPCTPTGARHGGPGAHRRRRPRWSSLSRAVTLGPIFNDPKGCIPCPSRPPLKPSAAEPVRYVGADQPDPRFYHGRLRHAVGVHRYQTLRANRCPLARGRVGRLDVQPAPMLAYWNDTYWLQYVSNQVTEHVPPGHTMLQSSLDGRAWSSPRVLFPIYSLPEIDHPEGHVAEGTPAVMHQRMGFYTAPDGRLLTLAFYSYCPQPPHRPQHGQGLGRAVREIYRDGVVRPDLLHPLQPPCRLERDQHPLPLLHHQPRRRFCRRLRSRCWPTS